MTTQICKATPGVTLYRYLDFHIIQDTNNYAVKFYYRIYWTLEDSKNTGNSSLCITYVCVHA